MREPIIDRDPGDETGMCRLCSNDVALPGDDFCRDCRLEIEGERALAKLEKQGRA